MPETLDSRAPVRWPRAPTCGQLSACRASGALARTTRLAVRGNQPLRARPTGRERVLRVGERTAVERQAATPDAILEVVPKLFELEDPPVELDLPALRDTLPVRARRRAVVGQQLQDRGHLGERDADALGDPDQRHSAQGVPLVPALVARRTAADNQTLALVEMQSRDRHATALRQLPDRQLTRLDVHRRHPSDLNLDRG